jgi:TonB family protein
MYRAPLSRCRSSRFGINSVKWLMVSGSAGVHLAVIVGLVALTPRGGPPARKALEAPAEVSAYIVEDPDTRDTVPVPEVKLLQPRSALDSIRMVRFTSADWGDISGVIAPASAPQLSRFQPVDPAVFARRAGLAEKQPASLVLTIEVLPDGRTGTVWMTRGSGNPAADEAAVAYARSLRWIPGTRDHHAEPMRVSLPITLVWKA